MREQCTKIVRIISKCERWKIFQSIEKSFLFSSRLYSNLVYYSENYAHQGRSRRCERKCRTLRDARRVTCASSIISIISFLNLIYRSFFYCALKEFISFEVKISGNYCDIEKKVMIKSIDIWCSKDSANIRTDYVI